MNSSENPYAAPAADLGSAQVEAAEAVVLDKAFTAGFVIRAVARAIDTALLGALVTFLAVIAAAIVLGLFHLSGTVPAGAEPRLEVALRHVGKWIVLPVLLAQAIVERVSGCTPGKFVCRLQVCDEEGRRPGWRAALVRNFACYVDGFFLAIPAYRVMRRSRWKQRIGDAFAHTLVMRRAGLPPERRASFGRVLLGVSLGVALSGGLLAAMLVQIVVSR